MVTRTHIAMPDELLAAIDAQVGPRRRSEFLVEAARQCLAQIERDQALDRFVGFLADDDTPGWNTRAETDAWVDEIRQPSRPDPWASVTDSTR